MFTSDHGEAFGDHPALLVGHGLPYESNQHVPLVLRLPELLPPGRVSKLVRSIDIYPTILEIAGVPLRHPINGLSLLPLILGEGPEAPDSETPDRDYAGATHHIAPYSFFRTARYKWMRNERNGELQIYDLAADPLEQSNLAGANPILVEQLETRVMEFLEETAIPVEGAGARPVTPEEIEELRALGYGE